MSILSRKWRRLWKCYPKLVFTRATMRSSDAMAGHQKPLRTRFIRGINSVTRQLKSVNLNKFVVKFALRKRHTPHIDRWINFSAKSRTKHVVLDLCPRRRFSADTDDRYSFPLHLFNASSGSCVKSLRLGYVYLTLSPDLGGFSNLKKLSLHKVQFCSLTKLDIQAPNLTTFVFDDYMIPIVLGEPLKISEATISLFASSDCFNYVFRDLVNALSHVQSLSISFGLETEVTRFVKSPTRLTNLRHLVLKIDISGKAETAGELLRLTYLLELAPVLEELVLNMSSFTSANHVQELSEDVYQPHPHSHLKTVHMTGFYGLRGQLELARYLLRNATSLNRMIIDPMVRNHWHIPPMVVAKVNMEIGEWAAISLLWTKEFRGVLSIL
ncbi:uncharacterized protein LOC100840170 [Brachypodium distachyon]|uniref:uncharacterized protein LOC100840170 n=1 Tax=Brachypodium distachyon TaxID=15368 RepID=UPI000D0E0B5D|nr:uncharacterized protein LOC100840170 [Brachypodium distachyon]|eukprot:XP_010240526.2 uncharacterized protein LOC100840170 [Brachypodium distachyon]